MVLRRKGVVLVSLWLWSVPIGLGAVVWAGEDGEVNVSPPEPQPSFHLRTGDLPDASPVDPRSIPIPDRSQTLMREPPTINGEFRVGEQTLIPYVGAGFGGGYLTERDRLLGPDPALQNRNILGDPGGRGYMPNEFQMGVRIPF